MTIYESIFGIPTGEKYEISSDHKRKENKKLLKTGLYLPQNHSEKPFDLTNFPSAPTSLNGLNKQ